MCDVIRHRGPDDEGLHVSGRVGLGMRRLSIIDLAGGHQPIFNEDHSKVIVFNGEIYNYRALRRDLLSRGHLINTQSDTETIVHLYEELGSDCVRSLRGMFAFALWDNTTETLLLARDRFGIKPLYTVTAPWGIAFASELKALHAVGLTHGDLDWNALDMFFRLGYIPAPATPFASVRKLEPGHLLTWRNGKATVERYWDLPTAEAIAEQDLEQRVVQWLDESVQAHMVSDVPVAAFLSGGIDSSAVVSSMAHAAEPPHAYTARYHGSGAEAADETDLARLLAQRYGAKLTIVDVRPNVRELFEPIVRALDEPHADDSAIPSWLISEAVAADYKVALVGTGGDELFAGYPRHIGLLLSEWYARVPGAIRRLASAGADLIPEPRDANPRVNRLKRFLRVGTESVAGRYLELINRFPNHGIGAFYSTHVGDAIHGHPTLERFEQSYDEGGAPPGLKAALYLDYKTYLPDDLLHLSDRVAMAHSLEIRVPFVDHELVERVFPLADRVRIGRGQKKRLLRAALRDRLPEQHFSAPKRGFVGPTAAWLRHELRDMLLDELSSDRMTRLGFFEPATVNRLLDEHFARKHNWEGALWELLCFSTWHRIFLETERPTPYAQRVATAGRNSSPDR
jgi:asparagine synthase (glutamine-hydrolysing)